MDNLTQKGFSANLNTKFQVMLDDTNSLELELLECNDLGSTQKQDQFSIVFRGALNSFLPQRIYQMEHEGLGSFSLFIVPVRKDNEGFYYEAIFNRFTKQSE